MKNSGIFFSLSLMFIFVLCCFMLLNIQIEDYTMLQKRTQKDFQTYTPVSYVTNKIHSYDVKDAVQIETIENVTVIKLSDEQSDTYLYQKNKNLMELCVIRGMQPDFNDGQKLMKCDEFKVKQKENQISCIVNGVKFKVYLRGGVVL